MIGCIKEIKTNREYYDNALALIDSIENGFRFNKNSRNIDRDLDIFKRLLNNETVKNVASLYNISKSDCEKIAYLFCKRCRYFNYIGEYAYNIETLNLSARAYNCLKAVSLNTIGALYDYYDQHKTFSSIHNLNERCQLELKQVLGLVSEGSSNYVVFNKKCKMYKSIDTTYWGTLDKAIIYRSLLSAESYCNGTNDLVPLEVNFTLKVV